MSNTAYPLHHSNPLLPLLKSKLPQSSLQGAGLQQALYISKTRSLVGQVADHITAASWRPRLLPATSTLHRTFQISISPSLGCQAGESPRPQPPRAPAWHCPFWALVLALTYLCSHHLGSNGRRPVNSLFPRHSLAFPPSLATLEGEGQMTYQYAD